MDHRVQQLEERVANLERIVGLQSANPESLYTPAEAAAWLRCGKTNVYDLIESGDLAVTRIGAGKMGMRVRGSALQAFLGSRTTGGPKPAKAFKNLRAYLG